MDYMFVCMEWNWGAAGRVMMDGVFIPTYPTCSLGRTAPAQGATDDGADPPTFGMQRLSGGGAVADAPSQPTPTT